ncbi:MAG: MBL fold metallo-hydrolase [Aquificaceae bacterium]|nr:MBL fold metallo-hydrolase [Aquificaceae bacterium]MDW8433797.1 MBL fold metallo-hydrolase [Aquificaceae bacterium]
MKESLEVHLLGTSGGRAKGKHNVCIYLPETVIIDAGNIFALDGERLLKIEHIILTHSHLDHLVDLPFLIDYTYGLRTKPLKVYGLSHTLGSLRKNIMNWDIWPEFGTLKLPMTDEYAVEYIEMQPQREYKIDGYSIMPLESKHTVPTISIMVKKNGKGFVYTSDTYKNPSLWEMVEKDTEIKAVFVDVSFPSYMSMVAQASMHNTPQSLSEDLKFLNRKDVKVYALHIKPSHQLEVVKELKSMNRRVYPLTGARKMKI